MTTPQILVVTSCTGEKLYKPSNQLKLEDFKDINRLQSCFEQLSEFAAPAGKMYTGQQHLQVMEGVHILRENLGRTSVDLLILSAGYGLIPESKTIVPYEVTFNTMKVHEIDEWAQFLGIHQAFEEAIIGYDLVFMLLGENYLRALSLPVLTQPSQTLIFLASHGSKNYIQSSEANTFILPLSNADAKRFGYGLVGLKGFIFKKFASIAAREPDWLQRVYSSPETFTQAISSDDNQLELTLGLPDVQPFAKLQTKAKIKQYDKDEFIPIPEDLPPAPNLHLGMQYFIPDWDDRVDPEYDFLTDTLTPERDPYADDKYAHEIYSTPNYDGILVSKVVLDANKKQRIHLNDVGIHKFLRFTGPIMGDCGAFGYIKEEVPPYKTHEILDYYERLGFNFGVSIDHLIVGPFAEPGVREKRYELTLINAQEFIEKHWYRGYRFTPIGAVQGWSTETYAEAVKAVIGMGYNYVALGGLARAQSGEILEVLKAVHPHLTPQTRLHLFGVARINTIPAFRHLGVTSCDSASVLRQAWLDPLANYHTTDKMYTAVRIPPVQGQGLRIRRVIDAGVADQETLLKLETEAIIALRKFDAGDSSLEETLSKVLAYDELVELPRDGKVDPYAQAKRRERHEVLYRELLTDQPWKNCDCPICKTIGIEVVIFRNNNRNRRRGFHNTYVLYKDFKKLLNELSTAQSRIYHKLKSVNNEVYGMKSPIIPQIHIIKNEEIPKDEAYQNLRILHFHSDAYALEHFNNNRYQFQHEPGDRTMLRCILSRKGSPKNYRLVATVHPTMKLFTEIVRYDPAYPPLDDYYAQGMMQAHKQTQSDFKGQKKSNTLDFCNYIIEGIKGVRTLYLPTITGWQAKKVFEKTIFVAFDEYDPNALYGAIYLPKAPIMQADGQTQTAAIFQAARSVDAINAGALDNLTVTLEIELNVSERQAAQSFADRNGRGSKKNKNLVISFDTSSAVSSLRVQAMEGTIFEYRLADGRNGGTGETATKAIVDLSTMEQMLLNVISCGKHKSEQFKHHYIPHFLPYAQEFLNLLEELFAKDWIEEPPSVKEPFRRLFVHGWPFCLKALAIAYHKSRIDQLGPLAAAIGTEHEDKDASRSVEEKYLCQAGIKKEQFREAPKVSFDEFKSRLEKIDWYRYRRHWIALTGYAVTKGQKKTFTLKESGTEVVVAKAQNTAVYIESVCDKILSDSWEELCSQENEPLE